MSQEFNTTSDTNPKPDGTPAVGGAPDALPRFSFARKKRVEEAPPTAAPVERPPPPPEPAAPQLKRPPAGARLTPSADANPQTMPAPLTPVKHGMTAMPFAGKAKASSRGHLFLWAALFVLVAIVGGESYYILMHDESIVAINKQKPPLLVSTGSGGKPYEVVNDGATPPTPAYGFLVTFSPSVAYGNEPRLFLDGKTYHISQIIAPEFGLKWTSVNDQTHELEFTDKQGRRYIKKF